MKKLLSLFFAIGLTLSACGKASTQPTPPTETGTLTITPTATQTPTATITPLPTIPTFTPTFDVSSIVTVTPAEKAVCPKESPKLEPDFNFCGSGDCSGSSLPEEILEFLNSGGSPKKIEKYITPLDVNNDGVIEYAHQNYSIIIYACKEGSYKTILEYHGTQRTPYLDHIIDLNNNAIPELIISNFERRAFRSVHILEWDGEEFRELIERSFVSFSSNPNGEVITYNWIGGTVMNYEFRDINNDGLQELIAVDEIPWADPGDLSSGLPWREETVTLGWDGKNYTVTNIDYSPPQYQFQSIQDGDRYTETQKYKEALELYKNAIFDSDLEWWSKDRQEYESYAVLNDWFHNAMSLMIATATPYPTLPPVFPDPAEYPSLAAYAYYRIFLLQLVQGQEAEAASTYQTLQDTFGSDPYAKPYIEMATAFWEAYQSMHKMYDGCAAAIQYAAEHPEILTPLGSDYHGWQSHIYVPADVCPFR
ncbi:MAG: hypothetical protein U0V18_12425 [Anaerolineales bacterium]